MWNTYVICVCVCVCVVSCILCINYFGKIDKKALMVVVLWLPQGVGTGLEEDLHFIV